MAYLRKRAAVACNYCRHRKRRCDAKTPACTLCLEAGVPCEYPYTPDGNPSSRASDAQLAPLLNRLDKLEALVQQQAASMAAWHDRPQSEPFFPSTSPDGFPGPAAPPTADLWAASPSTGTVSDGAAPLRRPDAANFLDDTLPDAIPGIIHDTPDKDAHDVSLIIPIGHCTTTGNLLLLPQIKSLLGYYPDNFFLQLETAQASAVHARVCKDGADHRLPAIDAATTTRLVDAFFQYIHPVFPVLDRDMFLPLHQQALAAGLHSDAPSALCLMIFALGQMALDVVVSPAVEAQTSLAGLEYFAPAYRIASAEWGFCHEADHVLPLALVHGALYMQYMNLPLQAWRLVHLTSISLQYCIATSRARLDDDNTTSTRLYWACFILESDTLAEFHVPRTGIELVVDKLQFPDLSSASGRDALLFLAVCSIRRLLNRIHSTLYASGQPTDTPTPGAPASTASVSASSYLPRVTESQFASVCSELVRQLKTWYASLPDEIRPDLDNRAPRDLRDGWLRLRYWSAMHIIGRPSAIFVAMAPASQTDFPPHVMAYCKLCLDSSRSIIAIASHILAQRTPYTWMIVHALLAHTLVVSLAASTPVLQSMVPDSGELLKRVADAVKPWATADSSAEMITWFVRVVRQKLRLKAINRLEGG